MLKVSRILTANSSRDAFEPASIQAVQNPTRREKLIEMPIDTFLGLCAGLPNGPWEDKMANIRAILKRGEKLNRIPSLTFETAPDGRAEVTSHEGRHRALGLQELGYTSIPVILYTGGTYPYGGQGIVWDALNNRESYDRYKGPWPKHLKGQDDRLTVDFPVTRSEGSEPFK